MSEAEIRAGVEVARAFHRKVNSHCRAAESVKRAVRCGVDVIYHCEHADTEALDLLEGEKHRVFVGSSDRPSVRRPRKASMLPAPTRSYASWSSSGR